MWVVDGGEDRVIMLATRQVGSAFGLGHGRLDSS